MPDKPMPGWMSGLQIVFLVMAVLGGINLTRPANNTAVLVFRIGCVAVGLVGSVVILILYLRHNRVADRDRDDEEQDEDEPRRRRRLRDDEG